MNFRIPARCTEASVDAALAAAGFELAIMPTPTPGGCVMGWGFEVRRPLQGGGSTCVFNGFETAREAAEWLATADLSAYREGFPY